MHTLNLGILAHVDAGKTSLTERLLYAAGVIDELGSVDGGSTQTDSLALERQRGITIKSAVVSFAVADVTVNLIDTPGHPDFIAEVERVLDVLDGAVLVISAVEGVQAQTRVLMRTLRRLRIPTLIFVNKTDRPGARCDGLLRDIARKLTPAIVAMGSAVRLGTRAADFVPAGARDAAFTARLADLLGDDADDELLAAYIDDEASVSHGQLREQLARLTSRGVAHPVYFGSAATGAGVDALTSAIIELLPAARGDADGPVAGTVFKIDRGPAGEKIAYVRMISGTLRPRDRVRYGAGAGADSGDRGDGDRAGGGDRRGKVTALDVFGHALADPADHPARPAEQLVAGQIGKVWGLGGVRIGDALGLPGTAAVRRHFAPPTLETVVVPRRPEDRGALRTALDQLAEQDPLIHARQDDVRQEVTVSLYGEVQKEVIQATLANDFAVEVEFRETTVVCVERVTGTGAAVERIGEAGNPFLATIGLRVDPAPVGSGVGFRLEIELGALPPAFLTAIEASARDTLRQGLRGWQVGDCTVTVTHSGYWARQSHAHGTFDRSMSSTAADFRDLTPLVLMAALQQAGTQVCEPVQHFRLEVPAETVGAVLPALTRLRAVPLTQEVRGPASTIEGDIPAAEVHALEQALPRLTSGEGMLDCAFDRYEPARGPIPARARSGRNPLSRPEYLLRIRR